MWLYSKREEFPDIIKEEYIPVLDAAHGMDMLHESTRKSRKNFCNSIIELLRNTNPSGNNCPVDIKKVNYNVMTMYLSSLKTSEGKESTKA